MLLNDAHRAALLDVLTWRRDVRHFKTDPVDQEVLDRLRATMDLAPSVGNARPWRVLQVKDADKRAAITADFETENAKAAALYSDDARRDYNALKLSGMHDAPVHLAIFTETAPREGRGLGRQTMPETLAYSTVGAIYTLWLAARAENIGLGWVSIINPERIKQILQTPDTWHLTGYLCLGHAEFQDDTPLLHKTGWQENVQTHWKTV
ncbi:5,6-dimethylbenzimidazole synthase [Nereida sp. MMG025]|uniref:5,6-dimethylbenzimidazole synthase n=1 Tax=Nereida sp. MMG025 TaxID=2909981 RepID=UPI001F0147CB|nr:5,6-dimethylbenzimidazole synthase [Nereida sp. MMG025]MCF6444896.1 5,6-dimethylbenzimidazole synthase [Nereida sp. MMG025]